MCLTHADWLELSGKWYQQASQKITVFAKLKELLAKQHTKQKLGNHSCFCQSISWSPLLHVPFGANQWHLWLPQCADILANSLKDKIIYGETMANRAEPMDLPHHFPPSQNYLGSRLVETQLLGVPENHSWTANLNNYDLYSGCWMILRLQL